MDSAIASENRHRTIRMPTELCFLDDGFASRSFGRRKLEEMVNLLTSVSIVIDLDGTARCERHKAHEQLTEMLCILPRKFDDGKVSLTITDKLGVLRLDKFRNLMLERRSEMLFNEVHFAGGRKSPSRNQHSGMRSDAYGLKYLFSRSKSLRLTNVEFKSCYPDARVIIECNPNLSNLAIENSLICEPIQFLNPYNSRLKSARITDSDLEILDYKVFTNVQTLEVAGNNTWIIEKVRGRALRELYIKPDHTQLYLTKLNPFTPKLEFLQIRAHPQLKS